jgi:anti-sigma regulatory factor (Ser/Thr protein kinase)
VTRPADVPVRGILLVQTDDSRGAGLRAALADELELEVVDEVSTTREAVASAGRHQPQVVVMDVGLDDVAGQGVLKALRGASSRSRIVLHAWAGDAGDAPGMRRWTSRLVEVVLASGAAAALEARLVLPAEPRSVPVARSFLTDLLTQWELDRFADEAMLLVSELVANAVLHVRGPLALELTHRADGFRVAVADAGAGMPDLQVLGRDAEGGRGLHIVSAFSSAWGVDHLGEGGKLVWAELVWAELESAGSSVP